MHSPPTRPNSRAYSGCDGRGRYNSIVLFDTKDRERILAGGITLTFRAWRTPKARVGGRYRFDPGHIAVHSVEIVAADAIPGSDAALAGQPDVRALLASIEAYTRTRLAPEAALYRVAFSYYPEPLAAPPRDEPATIATRLAKMDALAPGGPWTAATLRLIADQPRVVSHVLAREAGGERLAFKASVRKLKGLGLTTSFEVGYELTPLGHTVLALLAPSADPSG